MEKEGKELKLLIIDASSIHDIDSSGINRGGVYIILSSEPDLLIWSDRAGSRHSDEARRSKDRHAQLFYVYPRCGGAFHKRQQSGEEDSWTPDAVQTNESKRVTRRLFLIGSK